MNTNTEHHIYNLDNQTFGWNLLVGQIYQPTAVTANAAGNTCYLPYGNAIHSFIVPANRRPAPGATPIEVC